MQGEELQRIRLDMGETQESFSKMLGVSVRTLSRWECGSTVNGTAIKLINVFKVDT